MQIDKNSTTPWRFIEPIARALAASRVLLFPSKLRAFASYNVYPHGGRWERFYFFKHKYYLSKKLTLKQRFECAINHNGFERCGRGSDYREAVYGSSRGLTLWERTVDEKCYSIMLRATEDNRYEGDLSVLCLANGARVCRLSFTYVSGSLFGMPIARTMFVTRSQTNRGSELDLFRRAFRHNSPSYFCVAAVCGIAMANGMRKIFLIKDEAQIAYAPQYAAGFRNSYSEIWKAFGAEEIAGRGAFIMDIPLRIAPIEEVIHRSRAIKRRRNWSEVALSARKAMLRYRTHDAPEALPEEPDLLCSHPRRAHPREQLTELGPSDR